MTTETTTRTRQALLSYPEWLTKRGLCSGRIAALPEHLERLYRRGYARYCDEMTPRAPLRSQVASDALDTHERDRRAEILSMDRQTAQITPSDGRDGLPEQAAPSIDPVDVETLLEGLHWTQVAELERQEAFERKTRERARVLASGPNPPRGQPHPARWLGTCSGRVAQGAFWFIVGAVALWLVAGKVGLL